MPTNENVMVHYGYRRVSLSSLCKKFGLSRETVRVRYKNIGKPKRVYSWLFAPTEDWNKSPHREGLEKLQEDDGGWGLLSGRRNTGAARIDVDDSPKSYRRNSMGVQNVFTQIHGE